MCPLVLTGFRVSCIECRSGICAARTTFGSVSNSIAELNQQFVKSRYIYRFRQITFTSLKNTSIQAHQLGKKQWQSGSFRFPEEYITPGSSTCEYYHWSVMRLFRKLSCLLRICCNQREKDYASEQSSRVIDAYRTLENPLSRAIYLLKLKGVYVDQEQTISEPELLGEIMEIREAVDYQALTEIQIQMQEKQKHWAECFARAFQDQN
ncbi:unnamed protein product [Rhodiola kirilowii]